MRRSVTKALPVLLVAALLLPQLAQAGTTAARTTPRIKVKNGVTQPVFSYKDAIRETVYVQSKFDQDLDGDLDLLATDIIRPKETNNGLKVPAIYEMSPYYQLLGRGNESEVKEEENGDFVPEVFPLYYDNYFVPRGYAVILQDARGTRNSEGCMVLGANEEEQDAVATINWLNGKGKAFRGDGTPVKADWATGKVGMIGKSYDASIANGAASTGVDGLKTIVPIGGIDRWYDYHINNGVQYENAYTTPELFTFAIDQQPADDEERGVEWLEATFGEAGPCSEKAAEIDSQAGDPRADYNEFWDERDYLKDANKVKASVFVVHGINDWNVKPNNWSQWWKALSKQGVKRKMWLAQTGHVDPFEFRRGKWVRTLHRWFDRWLYGLHNGIMGEPAVSIEHGVGKWSNYGAWPARKARGVKLFFRAKKKRMPGGLAPAPEEPDAIQSYTDDPSQEESDMASNRFVVKGSRLLFETRKLKRALRLSGIVKVRLNASVDQVDTNFTALLVDYGKGTHVNEDSGEGVSNTGKETCYGAKTPKDNGCYQTVRRITQVQPYEIVSRGWLDAKHRKTLREGEPLTPGETYDFKWKIFGEDYIFRKGHRLGIVIAGSDATWTVPDPEAAAVDVNLYKSYVVLPLIKAARALRPY